MEPIEQARVLPTKTQWAAFERGLSHAHGYAKLVADGYEVSMQVAKARGLRYVVAVYVGGVFRGAWLVADCEERRRFCRVEQRHLFSRKVRDDFRRKHGVRALRRGRLDMKVTHYTPLWSSARALRRHLVANNRNIRIVSVGMEEFE